MVLRYSKLLSSLKKRHSPSASLLLLCSRSLHVMVFCSQCDLPTAEGFFGFPFATLQRLFFVAFCEHCMLIMCVKETALGVNPCCIWAALV